MRKWSLFSGLVLAMVLSACGNTDDNDDMEETQHNRTDPGIETVASPSDDADKTEVTMYNKDKEKVGTAVIRAVHTGVKVTLEGSDLPPGTHGFHIHEQGVCEAPDFKSSGGHFNPTDAKHGLEHPDGSHAGDMQNIRVDKDGNVFADAAVDKVTLEKGQDNSLLKEGGTALMIHSGADDYESQPSGDAGKRIACGVVSE